MPLTGHVALVTGGSLGIGRATVLALAREGANVAFTYLGVRNAADEAQQVVDEVRALGRACEAIESDVSIWGEADKVITAVTAQFGTLTILVNNAGITRDAVSWKMSEEEWDDVIAVNLKGSFNYMRAVAPLFRSQRAGKIVNVSSINGLRGKFGQANYSASKAGIVALTKTMAKELGRFNVNVNAVAPGIIATDMTVALPEEAKAKAIEEVVLGRLGTPDDVANAIVFLCSERAKHITGEVLKVDGGQYI